MQHGFAAGELHRVQSALLRDQLAYVLLEQFHRQNAVPSGIAVADLATKITGVRDFDENRARFIVHLISEPERVLVVTARITAVSWTTPGISATSTPKCRKRHDAIIGKPASPAILVREEVKAFVVFQNRIR